jgi:hypothetical protein
VLISPNIAGDLPIPPAAVIVTASASYGIYFYCCRGSCENRLLV